MNELLTSIDPFLIIYGFFAVAIGYIAKGLAGFGDPLIYQPLLTVFYPNSMVTPAMVPVGIGSNIVMVSKNRNSINLKLVGPIAIFNLLGDIPAVLLLKIGNPAPIKLFLGIVIVILGIEMITRKPSKTSRIVFPVMAIISFCSGFTAGMFGINLFYVAYLERVLKDRNEFRTSICFVFLCEASFRFILMLTMGLFNLNVILLAVVSFPAMLIGMWVGGKIDKRLSDKSSRRFMIYIYLLGGISTVIYAVIALLAK